MERSVPRSNGSCTHWSWSCNSLIHFTCYSAKQAWRIQMLLSLSSSVVVARLLQSSFTEMGFTGRTWRTFDCFEVVGLVSNEQNSVQRWGMGPELQAKQTDQQGTLWGWICFISILNLGAEAAIFTGLVTAMAENQRITEVGKDHPFQPATHDNTKQVSDLIYTTVTLSNSNCEVTSSG